MVAPKQNACMIWRFGTGGSRAGCLESEGGRATLWLKMVDESDEQMSDIAFICRHLKDGLSRWSMSWV
jgi:hypothetical protein